MGSLDGRVAIVTGAGRGIGRSVALLLASEGMSVVVNDLGGALDGSGSDSGPAREVAEAIAGSGGRAVASGADVSDHAAAQALIKTAISEFGRLDVLVNAAGILRDRITGRIVHAAGYEVALYSNPEPVIRVIGTGPWSLDALAEQVERSFGPALGKSSR